MLKYILKRLLLMIPTVMLIVLAAMAILSFVPGAGIRALSSYSSQGDTLDAVLEAMSLHGTFAGRYFRFLSNILLGDFSNMDRSTGVVMTVEFSMRVKHTILISLSGIVASLLLGLPLGTTAALYRGKGTDNTISAATLLISSIPSYCIAVICTLIFVVWLRVLPLTGFQTPANFVNPALVTALPGIAIVTAMTRSAVLRVMGEPYITFLRAQGVPPYRLLLRHIFKNAFVILMSSYQNVAIGILCTGMIAENFFSIPGLGVMLVKAVANRSAYLCLVCLVVFGFMVMFLSLFCDILCMIIDPRLRAKMLGGEQK